MQQTNTPWYLTGIVEAAQKGDADAQFALADRFWRGHIAPKDPEQAFYWYTQCANAGDIRGLRGLANCFAQGIGTEKDLQKAYDLLDHSLNRLMGVLG